MLSKCACVSSNLLWAASYDARNAGVSNAFNCKHDTQEKEKNKQKLIRFQNKLIWLVSSKSSNYGYDHYMHTLHYEIYVTTFFPFARRRNELDE